MPFRIQQQGYLYDVVCVFKGVEVQRVYIYLIGVIFACPTASFIFAFITG